MDVCALRCDRESFSWRSEVCDTMCDVARPRGGRGPLGGSPRSGCRACHPRGARRCGSARVNGYRTSWTAYKCSLDFDLCLVQTKLAARRGPPGTHKHIKHVSVHDGSVDRVFDEAEP